MNSIFETLIVLLINIICFGLGTWVGLSKKDQKLNLWFFCMSMFILLWVDFSFLGSNSESSVNSLMFYRLNASVVALFLVSFYFFFIIYFLKNNRTIFHNTVISLGLIFAAISVFTNLIIKGVDLQSWGNGAIFGPLNNLFNTYALFIAVFVIYKGIANYRKLDPKQKLQTQYFLFGIILYIIFNVVFNIASPIVLNTVQYQHFGDYSSIIFLGFTAYAMIKQKLFGARVITAVLFVAVIGGLLVLDIFIDNQTLTVKIFKVILFAIFVIFGFFLIRSVLREIRAREELAELSKALERANQHLQQLDKTKSEFLSIASHQLRTPISGIKGYLSMILEGDFGVIQDKPKDILKQIYDNTERLNGLINDFLDVSRIERGKLIMERQETDIHEMIQSIYINFQPVAHDKDLEFTYEEPKAPIPKLNVDPNKLRQVFLNLIDNAIKYTPRGSVAIRLEGKENKLVFQVKDTGVGLEPGSADKLFRPFVRAEDASKTNTTGSGLGLYVARKIIQYHGGTIHAESAGKGKGTTFIVEIPYDQSSIPEPEPEPYLE